MIMLAVYIFLYLILTIWTVWLFVNQYAARKFCQKLEIDTGYRRLMLPDYCITHRPAQIARYVLLFFIFQNVKSPGAGIAFVVIALALGMLAYTKAPVPYRYFLPIFKENVLKEIRTGFEKGHGDECMELYAGLNPEDLELA